MNHLDRFIRYASMDTESQEGNDTVPSTPQQWDLAKLLEKELKEMGVENAHVNEYGTVYAFLPATPGYEEKTAVGFLAHMDTVLGGKNVVPHVYPDYSGEDLTLADGSMLKVSHHPHLPSLKGKTLITSGGDTILGADDKAGVVAIMELADLLVKEPIPHGKVCIGFTPDEEIGKGVMKFDLQDFGAEVAFTVDGGSENAIEDENFNAAYATITAKGFLTHPGSAKDRMKNAIAALCEFQAMLPENETPENTQDHEGFYFLRDMKGDCTRAKARYLIRNFDATAFEEKKAYLYECAKKVNDHWKSDMVTVEIEDGYRNMKDIIDQHPAICQNMEEAIRRAGLTPKYLPVRGGTDGARLSYMGLPCPNLGAGGYAFHSFHEHCTVEGMEKSTQILLELVKLYAEQ